MTGFRLLGIVLVGMIVAQLNSWRPLDQMIVAALALVVLAYLWSRQSLRGIAGSHRTPSDRAQVGQAIADDIVVENRSLLGKLWLEVRDHSSLPGHQASRVIHLGGRKRLAWTAQSVCTRRGRFQLGPITLRSGDPFGLFPTRRRLLDPIDLLVYPAVVPLPSFVLPAATLSGGPTTNRRAQTVTPMVTGIRDYVQGDAFNRISWTATAKMGRLMVKEFDIDPTSDVWILLDLDEDYLARAEPDRRISLPGDAGEIERWLDSTEEYAVAISASVARSCVEQGRGVGLIATGAHYEIVQAERSDRTYIKMLEALAVVRADGRRPLAEVLVAESRRFGRDTALIVVTSSTDPGWIDAVGMLAARRVQASVIFVDGTSFGAPQPGELPLAGLVEARVRAYLVRRGDRIADALRSVSG